MDSLDEAINGGAKALLGYIHCRLVEAGRDGKKLTTLIDELAAAKASLETPTEEVDKCPHCCETGDLCAKHADAEEDTPLE